MYQYHYLFRYVPVPVPEPVPVQCCPTHLPTSHLSVAVTTQGKKNDVQAKDKSHITQQTRMVELSPISTTPNISVHHSLSSSTHAPTSSLMPLGCGSLVLRKFFAAMASRTMPSDVLCDSMYVCAKNLWYNKNNLDEDSVRLVRQTRDFDDNFVKYDFYCKDVGEN
jgi:hypothetical protein